MYSVILFGILTLCSQCMAIDFAGGAINNKTNMLQKIYFHMREQTVRFMFRHNYHILKNEHLRQKINAILSKYYDSIYHYYNLPDEEREFIETITNLIL